MGGDDVVGPHLSNGAFMKLKAFSKLSSSE